MRIIFWNVRGLGLSIKWGVLRNLISSYKAEMVLIQETKMELIKDYFIRNIWPDLNFEWLFQPSLGSSGGLLIISDKDIFLCCYSLQLRSALIMKGRWILHNFDCVICNVYAPCDLVDKNLLWSELLSLTSNSSDNCCFAGDFNAIRSVFERRGCVESDAGAADFNGFINSGCLFDVPLNGSKFTWFGPGNKNSRLDHVLVSIDWVNTFIDLNLRSLNSSISDHVPFLFTSDSAD
ncbi:hypothetical protein REPUB_Repub18cG0013800 [Reevesia pubescens]